MNQELLTKYLKGISTDQENQQVLSWIEVSDENRREFLKQRRLYDSALWHMQDEGAQLAEQKAEPNIFRKWMGIAAMIAILITGTVMVQQSIYRNSHEIYTQVVEVPQGQRVNLTLSDGTRVSLNSNSTLRFPSSFADNRRAVVLDGEGFFEVAHNSNKPFHVITEKCEVKVLGTKFNVLAYSGSEIFETSLVEGSVSVLNRKTDQHTLLEPMEKISLKNNNFVKSEFNSEDDFLWRQGIYVFNNEDLTEVFTKLEQYYQLEIEVKTKDIASKTCTGKFHQKEGIEHIIKVLQKANNFSYTRDEETNTITIY
jgi:ferric-dicitrate binding protein FerR (iron transport regulator)